MASRRASGTRVVLPAPGGAWSSMVLPAASRCTSSGSSGSIGRDTGVISWDPWRLRQP